MVKITGSASASRVDAHLCVERGVGAEECVPPTPHPFNFAEI